MTPGLKALLVSKVQNLMKIQNAFNLKHVFFKLRLPRDLATPP